MVHTTSIVDGVQTEIHLCLPCAKAEAGCDADATLAEVLQALVLRRSAKLDRGARRDD